MNRRGFVAGASAVGIGVLGAGVWRVESNHVLRAGEGPAYAPWKEWQQARTPFEQLVRAAVLAASPHNTQPWKFHLAPDGIDVYADTSRHIGAIDPLFREMDIGLGCAIENLLLGAGRAGYSWTFDTPRPSSDDTLKPIVRVLLKERGTDRVSDLYSAIPTRRTNRGPYLVGKGVDAEALNAIANVNNSDSAFRIFWFQQLDAKRAFGDLVIRATEAIIADPEQSRSSARWVRTSWSDTQRYRDGLPYDTQGLALNTRVFAEFLPPLDVNQTDRFWLSATGKTHVATASAFGVIAVRNARDMQQRVEAGRLWQRMHLFATLQGIAMHPLCQPVERRDREWQLGQSPTYEKALSDLQQDDSWQAVMPFRLGYPTYGAFPSPRRAIASVLI